MTALRRAAVLLAIALTTLIGLTAAPAQAAFNDKATLSAAVGTVTVAAPTNLSTAGTWCDTYTLHAKLSWNASTTARVTGYTITAYTSTGTVLESFSVAAGTTSYAVDADRGYVAYGVRVSITTLTSYGWTKESAKSGAITC